MPTTPTKRREANLREVTPVLMISVLEGVGTSEDPMEIVRYVVTKDGSILGKVEQEWITRTPRKIKP